MKGSLFFSAVALCLGALIDIATADAVNLKVAVFPSVQNLPLFAAKSKGLYSKRGLDVVIHLVKNSAELRGGLAEGQFQIVHSAIDNAFALKDKANVDIVVVAGGDNSMNHLIVQPEIYSLADVKGKTVAVDAVNTAYAFQLYEMLRKKGIGKDEYNVKAVGGTQLRYNAMRKDKSLSASMMGPPFSVLATKAGLKDMGTVAGALGPYQGASTFVLRKWAEDNADTLARYLQADIEGFRWVLDPANKKEAIVLLEEWLKLAPDIAADSYEAMNGGFSKDAALDVPGIRTVLDLRARYGNSRPANPDEYLDLLYYSKALSGLESPN